MAHSNEPRAAHLIGGGIHGAHLALVLLARAGVSRSRLRILDPHFEREGLLRVQPGEVRRASRLEDGSISLTLAEQTLTTQRVLLATGFTPQRPGGAWLDHAIAAHDLPLAPCGYPAIAPSLMWAPGLYVTGALAELELGPVARNIAGARHAGARLGGKAPSPS
ncbi:hypothetical protein CJ255_18335 [Candidatus Viridilinea mediisalina]|uniref:FAD/NAD(P)-binding domain-containing protein n=1 Tax=Candidatus Viridilinea mediisalina TaxID=2024553 RepID=A0A2A6REP2_9CHLR|nr:hypothetical protein CJ255_18335 [Candidatus Viridilinea mediisalina]